MPLTATSARTNDSARDLVSLSTVTWRWRRMWMPCVERPTINSGSCVRWYASCCLIGTAMLLAQAFISTRLDYCNSLLYGISDNLYRRLQAVQNAAARLITNTRRCEHITLVLQQLHWLPVRQRVQLKIAVLMYKALHDLLPAYLAEDCQLVSVTGRRQLRSSNIDTCWAQRTNTCFGDRSFAAAEPQVWNSLPTQLRESDITLGQFWRALKTHLFGYRQLQRRVTVFFVRSVQIGLPACLLT